MYKARHSTYNSLDELWEIHPDAVTCIKSYTHDYRGRVCIFTELEDFGIYEMTEGSYRDIINFDSPNVRPIHLESAIDFINMNLFGKQLAEVFDNEGDRYLRTWDYVIESPYGFR